MTPFLLVNVRHLIALLIAASGGVQSHAQLVGGTLPAGFIVDPGCETCYGLGVVPDPQAKPYVVVEGVKAKARGRAAASAQSPIAGKFCTECMDEELDKARTELCEEHRDQPDEFHLELEKAIGPLVRVHTRYVTIHTQLPPVEAQRVGMVVEALAAHLQKKCGSMRLTPLRATSYDSVSMIGMAPYQKFLKYWADKHPDQVQHDPIWPAIPKLAGGIRNRVAFFREIPSNNRHPVHFTVHQLARFTVLDSTQRKAPSWAVEGFGAYCEYIALRANRCHSISYSARDLTLKGSWLQNAKKLLQADKLTPWPMLERIDLRQFTPNDYLSSYTCVYFLMDTKAKEFADYLDVVADGTPSGEAFESSFGGTVDQLDQQRKVWLAKRRG